jgi:hypothetical protein
MWRAVCDSRSIFAKHAVVAQKSRLHLWRFYGHYVFDESLTIRNIEVAMRDNSHINETNVALVDLCYLIADGLELCEVIGNKYGFSKENIRDELSNLNIDCVSLLEKSFSDCSSIECESEVSMQMRPHGELC